jgi:hypothetical protein
MRSVGVTIDDPQQVVLESELYRRLAYTWHSFTHEFAERLELTDDARELSPRSSARWSRATTVSGSNRMKTLSGSSRGSMNRCASH